MLEFINNNATLCTILGSVFGVLITAIVSLVVANKQANRETVKSLKEELKEVCEEHDKFRNNLLAAQSLENIEKNIDKAHGHIYYEKLANGKTRAICGFCWEKEHIKIPLTVNICYEGYSRDQYYDGFCHVCQTHCIENIDCEPPEIVTEEFEEVDGELPF